MRHRSSIISLLVVSVIATACGSGSVEMSWAPFTAELAHTFTIATYSRSTTPIVHTEIRYKGVTGYGEAAMPQYLGETTESVCAFLQLANENVISKIKSPRNIEEIMAQIDMLDAPKEGENAVAKKNTAAKAAIDIALNDLVAKLAGQPWWKMHDIDSTKTPITSFTIGYDADDDVVRTKVEEAAWAKVLKVKLGISPEEDRRMISLIREKSDVPIYVDANQGWESKEEALEMMDWLQTQGVVLVEQPMKKELMAEHAWLKERAQLPIIADEACQRLSDIEKLKDAYDGINIKLMKCGGMTEAMKMIESARANGMKVMLGCMTETSVGISAVVQISPLADYADLDGNLLLSNDCFDGVHLYEGRQSLSGRPGIGVVAR
ncbi:MAG: dipeptide epimerase [Bacteroidales bacterium]|nr:dipeptide epimerase [Bacteroidales bacterium]